MIEARNNVKIFGDGTEATSGDILQFSCESPDEFLDGPERIYCGENGRWSDRVPSCIIGTSIGYSYLGFSHL